MKSFCKILISFLVFADLCGIASAERLPVYPETREKFNATDMPVTYAYFEDYVKRLFDAFNTRNFFWTGALIGGVEYVIHRDGTITDIDSRRGTKRNIYAKSIIESIPPGAFPKELKDDKILVGVLFSAEEDFDQISLCYRVFSPKYHDVNPAMLPWEGGIDIHMYKNPLRIRKRAAPVPRPW